MAQIHPERQTPPASVAVPGNPTTTKITHVKQLQKCFHAAKYTLRVKNVATSTTTASNSQIVKFCHC